ncbi:hypothetical protein NC652_033651 [Populus alba x Populus x berolinensis]|nr:hypothetical protein NC652_033651 [Populus alba x Populus x berolinensis]
MIRLGCWYCIPDPSTRASLLNLLKRYNCVVATSS